MELRFRCAFVSLLYRIWNSDTLLLRPGRFYCAYIYIYCALAVSATIRVILTKISNRSGIAVQWNKGLRRLLLGVFGCFLLFNYVSSLLCNIRGVFKKYADRCCHSLSFWLYSVKIAHNDAQRILYRECNFTDIICTHDKSMVVMVTSPRNTGPKI